MSTFITVVIAVAAEILSIFVYMELICHYVIRKFHSYRMRRQFDNEYDPWMDEPVDESLRHSTKLDDPTATDW